MKNKRLLILIAVLLVVIVAACASALLVMKGRQPSQKPSILSTQSASPLDTSDFVPIGLIGTVTALSTSTVTIEGQPPGNAQPVTLTVLVDAKTAIIKVGPAPAYATTTAKFTDMKKGMLLNISATAAQNGVRHADRVVIPPSTPPSAPSVPPPPLLPVASPTSTLH